MSLITLLAGHCRRYRSWKLMYLALKNLGRSKDAGNSLEMDILNLTLGARRWLRRDLYYRRIRRPFSKGMFGYFHPDHRTGVVDPPVLTILCPTRNRVSLVKTYIWSIYQTAANPEYLELLFYVDRDDPQLKGYLQLFDDVGHHCPNFGCCEAVIGEPMRAPKAWNVLAAKAKGDIPFNGQRRFVLRGFRLGQGHCSRS